MLFSYILQCVVLLACVLAAPLKKRFYSPSSPVFSVIAHHKGRVFSYNLLKFDGEDLLLNADEEAFFGRVRAAQGYILNLPLVNTTTNRTSIDDKLSTPGTINVRVDPKTHKLTTTRKANESSHGFGISKQKLTYHNLTEFLACPTASYRGEYELYWGGRNVTHCPNNSTGYIVELITQTDATIDYTPETNVDRFNVTSELSKRSKRFHWF